MKTKLIASGLVVALLATGCETGPKQAVGTLGGGALGAWAGSTIGQGRGRVVATAVGAVLGAFLGSSIGRELDAADEKLARQTAQGSFESSKTGQTSSWRNPDTGHSGTITPTKTYHSTSGQYCREFQQTIVVGGKTERGFGTACRQPDGSWQIQN